MNILLSLLNSKGLIIIAGVLLSGYVYLNIQANNKLKEQNKELVTQIQTQQATILSKEYEINSLQTQIKKIQLSYEKQLKFNKAQTKELNSIKSKIRKYKDENISDGLMFAISSVNERLQRTATKDTNSTTASFADTGNTTTNNHYTK